ncbi:hypothetical protein C3L33_04090, partial [Rhododendron williamsianum]
MAVRLTWSSAFRAGLFLILLAAITSAFITLPVEKVISLSLYGYRIIYILKDFLLWVKHDLGPWGPLALGLNEYHLHFLIDSNDEYLFWFLLQPITFTFVYVGTTLKDLSDVTHGWAEVSKTRWVSAMPPIVALMAAGFLISDENDKLVSSAQEKEFLSA